MLAEAKVWDRVVAGWLAGPRDSRSSSSSVPTAYGNDGGAWQSGAASPGSVNFATTLAADFNGDGSHTLADLDFLVGAVASQSALVFFDLNHSGTLNGTDIEVLVEDIVGAIPGDYNWDATVDQADYSEWKSRFGSALYLNADGNRDGSVDAADYTVWRDKLGTSGGAGAMAASGKNESAAGGEIVVSAEGSTAEAPEVGAVLAASAPVPPRAIDAAMEGLFEKDSMRSVRAEGC